MIFNYFLAVDVLVRFNDRALSAAHPKALHLFGFLYLRHRSALKRLFLIVERPTDTLESEYFVLALAHPFHLFFQNFFETEDIRFAITEGFVHGEKGKDHKAADDKSVGTILVLWVVCQDCHVDEHKEDYNHYKGEYT